MPKITLTYSNYSLFPIYNIKCISQKDFFLFALLNLRSELMLDCESLMSACDGIFCVKYDYCIMRHFNISTLYRRIKCVLYV